MRPQNEAVLTSTHDLYVKQIHFLFDNKSRLLYRHFNLIKYDLLFQSQPTTFNRGLLVNIGATFAMESKTDFNCFVIHDVDLLPMIDSNIYTCGDNPRHMSSANSKFGYR